MAADRKQFTTALSVTVVLFLANAAMRFFVLKLLPISSMMRIGVFEFGIRRELNTAWAFSIPFPQALIILVSMIALVILAIVYLKGIFKGGLTAQISFSAIMAGALYNLFERILHGAVLDYIAIGIGSAVGTWNVADVFIILGIIGLVIAERRTKHVD